jgi:predicted RNase H-like nuclease
MRIGRSKAYQMLANGELPGAIRLGRAVRVSAKVLRDWIDQQAAGSGESHTAVLLADRPTVIDDKHGRRSPDRLRGEHRDRDGGDGRAGR